MKTTDKLTGDGQKQVEQIMQTSLQLLPMIMNNIPQAVFWKDRDLVYLGCNQAFAEDAGFASPEEVVGKTDFDMPWKDQTELYRADDRRVMESGEPKLNYEEPQTTPNGATIWLSTSKIPVNENGQVVAILGMYEDITARKQAEQAIHESEERFRRFTDATNEGLVFHERGRIIDVNPAVLGMFGLSNPEELIGRSLLEFVVPEWHELVLKQMQLETVQPYEIQCICKDGSIFPVETSTRTYKSGDRTIRATSVRDITERKQTEEAIQESRSRFQGLVEMLSDWIWELDQNGTYTYASPKVKDLLGYEPEEVLGKTPFDLMPPEEAQRVAGVFGPLLSAQEPLVALENTNRHKDGHLVVFETSGGPYFDAQGQFKGYRGTDRNITERKWLEQQTNKALENERIASARLRDVMNAGYELMQTPDLDSLYRQTVELAHTKLGVERCGLFILDDAGEFLVGTYGTDEKGNIVDERSEANRLSTTQGEEHDLLFAPRERLWTTKFKERTAWHNGRVQFLEPGWNVATVIQGPTGPRGVLYNDGAISNAPYDESLQEAIALYCSMLANIIESKQAEAAVSESEERFRRFTEATIEGLIFHEQGKIVDVNPAAVALFGFSDASGLIGRNLLEFILPELHELVLQKMQSQTVLPYEVRCIHKDGSTFPVETSTRAYKIGDREIRASTLHDITERKQAEKQIQTAFERRGRQVQLSTQVSQSVATATNLEDLYQRVVTQVKEQFGYYHTQLLRYDPVQNAVILVTGYGETGAKMLAAGHRMPMGEGLIGTAAATGETVLLSVLENDPDWHPDPLFPDTKGEIAVPIKLGNTVLGVLDIQSSDAGVLGTDEQLSLEGLCGQIATAIESTRLRQEMAERLDEINRLYRAMSHEGWQNYRETTDIPTSFMFDQSGLRPVKNIGLADELFANVPLTVPGGEVIGTLAVAEDPQHPISTEDQAFIQQISEQVAMALESARLFEQTQMALSEVARRASELETVAKVSATTSTVLDPDMLLQSVVDLTKERFGLYHAHIYLVDDAKQILNLSVGAGETGRKMVAEGHALALDAERSLVVRAAHERQAVIVNDVHSESGLLPNPALPETRSEMAVPMIVGDTVLGVFDVQSNKLSGFSKEDANIYATLAAQVAVALQNARLYAEQATTVTKLRELDRLKSSFLANMSHELRTPLNSILGFADVMLEELDGPITENMNNDLQLIYKNGQHLLHLINDVLDMAKIESGRMNLNPEKFKIQEILQEVVSITSTFASEKGLSLFIEDDSDQDVEVHADRTRIRQVMINLVNNALKFTEQGKISIRATRQDENILICVRDTGIGIPVDKLEAVFQEFIQVDTSTTRKAGGTGLGLPISRRLIDLHGGRMWAESTGVYGSGSTFYVELPIEARITEYIEKQEK